MHRCRKDILTVSVLGADIYAIHVFKNGRPPDASLFNILSGLMEIYVCIREGTASYLKKGARESLELIDISRDARCIYRAVSSFITPVITVRQRS